MSLEKPRALVVDDKEENLYLLEALLKGNGFAVSSARNGSLALELARKDRPDLVISDILMPVMDGFTLCRTWKRDPLLRSIPFVFYTATYTDPKDERLALSLGADMFIIKPKEPQKFMGLVQDVLRRHRAGELGRNAEEAAPEDLYLREYNQALVRKLERKVEELAKTNLELRSALADKQALLRELFHRTRNNMQLIVSILELEAIASGHPETQRLARNIETRIKALSLISQKLHESRNVSRINLRTYLTDLAKLLQRGISARSSGVDLKLDIRPDEVLIDTAIPCGLAVNELLSNALRHAFPQGRPGSIRIQCGKSHEGVFELSVSDDGVGFPPGLDFRNPSTLGLQMVKVAVEQQLQGSMEITALGGVRCRIRFKDNLYTERV